MILKIDTHSVMVIYLNLGMSRFYTEEQRQDRKDICPAGAGAYLQEEKKMLKKLYKWTAIIVSMYVGINSGSLDEMFAMIFYFCAVYLGVKVLLAYFRRETRSSGGVLRWFFKMADTTQNDRKIFDSVWNAFRSGNGGSGWDAKREADQRVFNRTKAQNEAMYHQYYADKNRGTYDGYRSQNRADAARDRANRY